MDLQGKTIIGFEMKRPLGVGGMAEVWYAENEIGKPAAVKMLNMELSGNAQIVERFRSEAEIMVKLNHPNIRQVYGYGSVEGRPAMVMEYLDGDDMKAMIKRGQKFSEEEFERWWNQMVAALNYTHKQGIVHRDIKPANIFIDSEGNIKLLDFGIAKIRDSITSTQTGQKLGTLMYMSPEQVRSTKHTDYRTDIYSLAVTFVHLLSGKTPYDSDTSSDFEISECIVYKPLDMSGVPDSWRRFLGPYLEKQPESRPELRLFDGCSSAEPVKNEDNTKSEQQTISQKPAEPQPSNDGDETVYEDAPQPAKKVAPAKQNTKSQTNNDKVEQSSNTMMPEAPNVSAPAPAPAKSKKTLIFVLIAVIVLGAGIAIVWNVIVHGEKDKERIAKLTEKYEEKVNRSDFYLRNIVKDIDGNIASKSMIIECLNVLKEIEDIEAAPNFGKAEITPCFQDKLSSYRRNLEEAKNALQVEFHDLESLGIAGDDNAYAVDLKRKIRLIDDILDQSNGGSVKNVEIKKKD